MLENIYSSNGITSRIRSLGVYLPTRIVDNEEISTMINNSNRSFRSSVVRYLDSLTGIQTRRWADYYDSPSSLAVNAAQIAIENSGLKPNQIDTLIFASTDTDLLEPATANVIQNKIGVKALNSFDVKNACNSFLQAMFILNALIVSGACKYGLIVSGEIGSHVISFDIKNKHELNIKLGGLTLGDGGAALIMERSDNCLGIQEVNLINLSDFWECCHVPHDVNWRSRKRRSIHGWFYLDMTALAKVVKKYIPEYFRQYASYRFKKFQEESFLQSVDLIIPHQISKKFIELMCSETNIPIDKTIVTAHRFGNTASTSIPIALDFAMKSKQLSLGSGFEVILFGAASGFSLGHARIKL